MAELAADYTFVYMGGQQVVPEDVTHVVIDRSVNIIPEGAFAGREQLVSVKFHDGVEQIERWAFYLMSPPERNQIARREEY